LMLLSIVVLILLVVLTITHSHDRNIAERDALVLAVVVASLSLAYAGWRQIRINREWRRLRESETWQDKLFREKSTIEGIIEGSPIPTFVIGRDHKIMFWNKACADLMGYDAGEMIGTDRQYLPFYQEKRPVIADLIVDNDIEGLEKYYGKKRVQKSAVIDGAYEARDYYKELGGRSRYLYFLAAPIRDEKGAIIAAIETLQDVSREEEMAANLKEYAETLQNELSENVRLRQEIEGVYNYLRSIVDSSPDTLFDLSSDGIINYISGNLQKGKGFIFRESKGKPFTEFVAPEHRTLALAVWEDVKKGIYQPFEIEATEKDGSKRSLLVTPRPIEGTDRYVFVQRDITEFKDLEKKFYESEKLAAIGQLSAGIAHEVRNPLSSIKMSLQILEKRMQPEGNDLKRFRIAQREVEHLEELVNDVLIYAKPAVPKKEPSDIRRIVENALALVERLVTDKNIRIHTELEDSLPFLQVDSAMLEQAFLNIYRNAVDAMEMDGILRTTARRTGNDPAQLQITVEDNGCGIEASDLPHIFNPFFTKKKYGTGLGMTQVKKIIDLHRGSIEVSSKKAEGTRVMVTFPLNQEG
jgi:PAS domain S-box-containing protein